MSNNYSDSILLNLPLRFLNGSDEAFSTEPLKNDNEDLALGFYHMKNVNSHVKYISHVHTQYLATV